MNTITICNSIAYTPLYIHCSWSQPVNSLLSFLTCSFIKARKAKKYASDSPVIFSQSTESTSINMSSMEQKPELGIPNPCAVKENEYVMGPELSTEATATF